MLLWNRVSHVASLLLVAVPVLPACGSDEVLDMPSQAPNVTMDSGSILPDAGAQAPQLDLCRAASTLLQQPSVTEALCALALGGASSGAASDPGAGAAPGEPMADGQASAQCQQCTAVARLVFTLTPPASCPREIENCQADDATLAACVTDAAQTLSATLPGCDSSGAPATQADLVRAFSSGSCVLLALECPAALDALVSSTQLPSL